MFDLICWFSSIMFEKFVLLRSRLAKDEGTIKDMALGQWPCQGWLVLGLYPHNLN